MNPNDAPVWSRPAYRRWFLFMLTATYALNFLDRQLLSILAQPIKEELQLDDTSLGMLGGIYFALFYATLGVPIARLSDRTNRVRLIAGAIALWSVATATCGLAQRFWHLALSRVAVAIGESAATPPSYSLIADLYPRASRSGATGLFTTGTAVGSALGLALGGWVGREFGWRPAFFLIGLPGVLIAAIIFMTLKEPPRGFADEKPGAAEPVGLLTVFRVLLGSRTFPAIALGIGTASISGYALGFWMPSFMVRSFDMNIAQVGWQVALAGGLGGVIGGGAGGWICDRLALRDRRWWLWAPALAFFANIPLVYLLFNSASATLALVLFALVQFNYHFWGGSGHAMVQSLVGQRMRAVAAAAFLLVINLVGLGLGPMVVGMVSDLMVRAYGAEALRHALMATAPVFLVAGLLLLLGSTTLRRDLDSAPA
jgi:predicted MFS family arabinose efflux permease